MKNKIFKYDFLVVGGGLIGALTALSLHKKKLKVLVIDNKIDFSKDQRTLAVNANSKEFLLQLGVWNYIKTKPQFIKKIIIKDYINNDPLIFKNDNENMGNVIFNTELHKIIWQKLENLRILKTNIDIDLNNLKPMKIIYINNHKYSFKKIIISIGKKLISDVSQKSIVFDKGDYSYVGFFKHKKDHRGNAYEIFNEEGPLAVLPCPSKNNRKSTFIYSSKYDIQDKKIQSLINRNFSLSHGQIIFEKKIHKFPITPHLIRYNKNYIYVGDSLKSIHPVAGQGWNLGVKDIQFLLKLIDKYPLESETFNSIYYSRRIIEGTAYFGFTSLINFLYENKSNLNTNFIKFGFQGLKNFTFIRRLFIKQAMGRLSLFG